MPARGPGGTAATTAGATEDGPISLGSATVEQLETIDGIGPVDGGQDRRIPRPARRALLGRSARPGERHRPGDDGIAARTAAAVGDVGRAAAPAAAARRRRGRAGAGAQRADPRPRRGGAGTRHAAARGGPGARLRARRGRGSGSRDDRRLPPRRPHPPARRLGPERRPAGAAGDAAAGRARHAAARPPGLGPRPDRRLRAAGRRRPVDPARRRDGRAERAGDAGRAARLAPLRAGGRRGGHAGARARASPPTSAGSSASPPCSASCCSPRRCGGRSSPGSASTAGGGRSPRGPR